MIQLFLISENKPFTFRAMLQRFEAHYLYCIKYSTMKDACHSKRQLLQQGSNAIINTP